MSYVNSLLQYRNVADRIRSGEYQPKAKQIAAETKQSLLSRPQREEEVSTPVSQEDDMSTVFMDYMMKMQDRINEGKDPGDGIDTQTVTSATRPRTRDDGGDTETIRNQASDLLADELFASTLESMKEKYPGLTEGEIFRVIKGESAFNLQAQNPSGATGLFQFIPTTAKELGVTTEEIKGMTAGEQLQLYDRYLEKWGYDGRISLGAMQAAPAYANKDPETVVYKKGSAAWKQNPGWREGGDGDITLASIDNYYRRQ